MSVYENLDLNDREYLQRTLERVREAIAETLALLTGKDYVLGEPSFDMDSVEVLSGFFTGKSVIAKGEFTSGLEGNYTIVISGRDAIAIAGLMAGAGEEEVAEKIELGVTEHVLKDFEEVARQMFVNIGVFLTRLFDTEMSFKLKEVTVSDMAAKPLSFIESTGLDESVVVLYQSEMLGALAMLIPLGVAKELATIGLPGLPKRTPAPRRDERPSGKTLENIDRLLKIEMPVVVRLAEKVETLDKVLNFSEGHIIEFEKGSDEMLELLIVDKLIGHGEAVKIGENFGIRIRKIGTPRETLHKLR